MKPEIIRAKTISMSICDNAVLHIQFHDDDGKIFAVAEMCYGVTEDFFINLSTKYCELADMVEPKADTDRVHT